MKSFVFVFACFIATAYSAAFLGDDDEWEKFKVKYEKQYDPEEEIYRKEIWRANLKVRCIGIWMTLRMLNLNYCLQSMNLNG